MKKLLALLIVFLMLPTSKVLAYDTPNTENSTENSKETRNEDSLKKKYNEFSNMDDKQWIEDLGNKDLYGRDKSNGEFELTGLMGEFFFDVKNMLPGDTVTKYIRISNSSDRDYSLSFDAHRSEEKMPKKGEVDLFNVLDLEIMKTSGESLELVYRGKVFDENTNQQVIKLGTIKSKQPPIIFKATVTMDPKAGDEYKGRSAEIDWRFVAEGDEKNTHIPSKPSKNDPSSDPQNDPPNDPKSNPLSDPLSSPPDTVDLNSYTGKGEYLGNVSETGDSNYLLIYALLAFGSFMIGYVLFSKGKKSGKEQ